MRDLVGGVVGGDDGLLAADLVLLGVQLQAQELQALHDPGAEGGGVLADAAGEDQRVQAAHGGGTGADALGDLVAEDVDSQLGALVALGSGGLQVTEVGGHAGDAQHAGLLVQGALHALGGVPRWSTM